MIAEPFDRDAVEALAGKFLIDIRAHYLERPTARSTVQEILNALACSAAYVIHGTGSPESRKEARAFFNQALSQQLSDL